MSNLYKNYPTICTFCNLNLKELVELDNLGKPKSPGVKCSNCGKNATVLVYSNLGIILGQLNSQIRQIKEKLND